EGAMPLTKTTRLKAGDLIVSSELSRQVEIHEPVQPVTHAFEIRPSIPLRLIGLNSQSGYSDASKGFWPFGISTAAADRVHVVEVGERNPTLEYLTMTAPAAGAHIVGGIWANDNWTSATGIVVLKSPATPKPLSAEFYIPETAPARRVSLWLDGKE